MVFGIKTPLELGLNIEHGSISDLIPFPSTHNQTRFIIYAASVFNKYSSYEIIKGIGERIGLLVASNPSIIHIETPLLGAGAGQLKHELSGRALYEGFVSTASDEAILFIFANDDVKFNAVNRAVGSGLMKRIWDATELKFGISGIKINLKKFLSKGH